MTGTPGSEGRVHADRVALNELVARYAWSVAQGKGAAVAELFCEDGWFESSGSRVEGRQALAEFFSRMAGAFGGTVPLVGNTIFELDGDAAMGLATLIGFRQGGSSVFAGHYQDSFRRTEGIWRFAGRRFETYFGASAPRPLPQSQ